MGNNEWLDIDVLDDYLEGKLDASTMHKVERISLEDPFVAQALAGLTEAKKRTQTLSLLQKQLQARVEQKPIEHKMWRITSMRLSIAATAAVLFIAVSVLFWFRESNRQKQLEVAANQPKEVEVQLRNDAVVPTLLDTPAVITEDIALNKTAVEEILAKTVNSGALAIAKNKEVKIDVPTDAILGEKSFKSAKLNRNTEGSNPTIIGPPLAAPASPVQALNSRVEDIQVQTSNAKLVKGLVLDINGKPIAGANVQMVGDDLRAITNKSGEFELAVNKDSNKITLDVASVGYARKNVEAKTNDQLNIRLEESNSALSEVVVVSGVASRKVSAPNVNANAPVIGWEAFEKYLTQNNKLFGKGNLIVELAFSINKDGKPVDIKLLKAQSKSINEEAIRLLNGGPRWEYKASSENKAKVAIKF